MTAPALLRVLRGEPSSPAPVWLMRQAGRYLPEYRETRLRAGSFLDLCFTPDLATEVTLQPIRRFGFDAAILFSDILVAPWAMGQSVRFEEGVGPIVETVRSRADAEALAVEGAVERLEPVLQAVRQIKAALPAGTPLIGFAGAPWTLATYLFGGKGSVDQAPTKLAALGDPEMFSLTMAKLEQLVGDFLIAQIDAGVDAVKIFDSWAGAATAAMMREHVEAPLARLTARLKRERPEAPVIVFPRGVGSALERMQSVIAPDGLALDSGVDAAWAAQTLTSATALQGNIDPVFMRGPEAALLVELDRLRDAMRGRPHILNLGHGITPEADIARVEAMLTHWRAQPA